MGIKDFAINFFCLEGKNAIVTGGNTGLGRTFALALAAAGANLFIPSIREDDGTTRTLIENEGVKMEFMHQDITEPGAARRIVEGCVDTFGSLDILINSAGISKNVRDVLAFGRTEWDAMLNVNLTAPFELSYEAAKVMIPQCRGKIINICSMYSFLGGQWSPAYASTKHGLVGFTKAYCDELAQYNIQVNGIAPGYFATDLTLDTRNDPESNKRVIDHIPAGRWGEPLDLMGATVFLASKASDYVNGQILIVDGGYLVR
ncbi:MAG: SDR family oxidoreductase [Bacillota bacterium]|nr:SDR family oxidoreductase [Bacillota bacterium]MDW7730084.1 SDR family oxidoreductase [Bacillota bacterium]